MPAIVRHLRAMLPARPGRLLAAALLLPANSVGADAVHLLGFVEGLCVGEAYCFDLLVKPEFAAATGERIRVRFADVETIYDAENYELMLAQQNIAVGSHLRLLITRDSERAPGEYQARFIWIGD